MALVLADRVQETSTSTGTGSFTLDGAVTGYQTFAVIGNGNTTFYTIADQGGANWEVGIGTYSTTGPTLARTTVLSNSNGNTSQVNFTAGTKTVFVTYPSEQSVNLNASGNVSALGTVSSGVWQGTTVGVAYGGTGVTSSSGANSVMLRDANQNVAVNRLNQSNTSTTAAGGVTALTTASSYIHTLAGTGDQTYTMPDATTLSTGVAFLFNNMATGTLTLQNFASGAIGTIPSGGAGAVFLTINATVGGTWDLHSYLPEGVTFGTNAFNLGTAIVSGGTWQGGTIQPAYGGTGLTTFTGANNALYSTGSSTLTAGTLPVPAGGTGVTSATANGIVYGNGTSALQITAAGTTGQVLLGNTGSAPSWGSVPAGSITGTLPIANGGTGQTTAAAAFNALSPITTTGDLIVGNGSNSATRLGIGSTGQVLTVSGGTTVWSTPTTGGGTITRTDFTATAGQTVFTVSYTVGLIDVYQNGAKLAQADFTATNGTSFTLATGATAGDLIQAEVFSSLNLYSTITYQVFNGDGTTTVFTMSSVPANSASLLVAISGVVQDPGTYTVSSTTLTFLTAPPAGTGNISVRYLGIASVGTVGSFSAGTTGLTPSSATTGAVVLAGTLNVANGGTGLTAVGTNGQVLTSNGTTLSYQTPVSTPGGSNTQVQYNSGGAFAGSANMVFDGSTLTTLNAAYTGTLTGGTGIVNLGSGQFYKDASGNVGIGTSSPTNQLDVFTSGSGTAIIRSSNAALRFVSTGGENYIQSGTAATSSSAAPLIFSNVGGTGETMRIDSSGNVGIGIAAPSDKLDVSGTSRYRFRTTNAYTLQINSNAAGNAYADEYHDASQYIYQVSGTERMRIDGSGNVGIGTSTIQSWTKLEVRGTAGAQTGASQQVIIAAPTTTAGQGAGIRLNAASGAKEAVAVIGVVNEASGNSGALVFHNYNAGADIPERMRITSTGQLRTTVTGTTMMDDYGCRAWVNFNGTGTVAIRASGNVSSITDNANGDYTVNFTTAMPDVNYAATFGVSSQSGVSSLVGTISVDTAMGTSTCRIQSKQMNSATNTDGSVVTVAFFR